MQPSISALSRTVAEAESSTVTRTPEQVIAAEDAQYAYYSTWQPEIESSLAEAVGRAMKRREGDPLVCIAQELLRMRGEPTEAAVLGRRPSLSHATANELSDDDNKAVWVGLKGAIQKVIEKSRLSRARSCPERPSIPWRASQWVESLNVVDIITDALLKPLKEETSDPELEKDFIQALGEHTDERCITAALEQCVGSLSEAMYLAAAEIGRRDCPLTDDALVETETSKFFDGAVGHGEASQAAPDGVSRLTTLQFGGVSNYGTETTPQIEFYFVFEPTPERLRRLELPEWPVERELIKSDPLDAALDPEQADRVRQQRRYARPPAEFEAQMADKNALLRRQGLKPIVEEEVLGSRLYTGPMYFKYNRVLREVGRARGDKRDEYISSDRMEELAGNMYTTTLHVINSAIIKLGKLTVAGKVYRGMSERLLPQWLANPNDQKVRGGVEFGFMSCSKKEGEALKYAQRGERPILLEMQMGMIDRGADFSWLSQYPHEDEILFAPLSGLEVLSHRLDKEQGVLVVSVRPSVNLQALTIEDVVAKMQRSHLQLIDLLTDDLRFAGVSSDALMPLTSHKVDAQQRPPDWFNSTRNYRDATQIALDKQVDVFHHLVDQSERNTQGMEPRKIRRTAVICARAGEHKLAIQLLLKERDARDQAANTALSRMPSGVSPMGAGRPRRMSDSLSTSIPAHELPSDLSEEETREYGEAAAKLYQVARRLMEDGLQQPWPATFVTMGDRRRASAADPASNTGRPLSDRCSRYADRRGSFAARPTATARSPSMLEAFSVAEDRERVAREDADAALTTLPPPLFKRLIAFLSEQYDPFQLGRLVLCNSNAAERWEYARLEAVNWKPPPDTAEPRTALPDTAEPGTALPDGMAASGARAAVLSYHLDLDRRHVPAEHVLLPDRQTGTGAVLRRAAEVGADELVCLALASGVSGYQCDALGNTALLLASTHNHKRSCELLMQATPKIEKVRNIGRQSAYDLAVSYGHPQIIRLFAKNPSDSDLGEAEIEAFRKQLDSWREGTLPGSLYHEGVPSAKVTALMLASRINERDVVKHLIDFLREHGSLEQAVRVELGTRGSRFISSSVPSVTATDPDATAADPEADPTGAEAAHSARGGADGDTVADGTVVGGGGRAVRFTEEEDEDDDEAEKFVRQYINECSRSGCTALMLASEEGHKAIVEELLKANADHSISTQQGHTALMLAAGGGNKGVVELLLHQKADTSVRRVKWDAARSINKDGRTILMIACHHGHAQIVKVLIEHSEERAQLNALNYHGESALTFATRYGHTDTVKLLLDKGAELLVELCKPFWTSLHRAAANGHEATCTALIRHVARSHEPSQTLTLLNHTDAKGTTPLMAAANSNYSTTVALLIEAQADVERRDHNGETTLFKASKLGQKESVLTLLRMAPPRRSDASEPLIDMRTNGQLGLRWLIVDTPPVARDGQPPPVQLLHGALVDTISQRAPTAPPPEASSVASLAEAATAAMDRVAPLEVLISLSELAALGIGPEAPDPTNPRQPDALSLSDLTPAAYVQAAGRIFVCERGLGATPLMAACKAGHEEIARVLLHAKADVGLECDGLGDESADALSIAASRKDETLLRVLLSHRPTTGDGCAALVERARQVAHARGPSHAGIVKIIRDSQADWQPPTSAAERADQRLKQEVMLRETESDERLEPSVIERECTPLAFRECYRGHLVPPRPSAAELARLQTASGTLLEHNGVVIQRGKFSSIWLRVGCVPASPWHKLWQTFKAYTKHHLAAQRALARSGGTPAAVYVAVAQRSMQAIDFAWLADEQFVFHHYRAPGHGASDPGHGASDPATAMPATALVGTQAELVYYSWPGVDGTGSADDMVPVYSTSIEGAKAVCFSPALEKVLLVFERGAWNTPGGAVDMGESKLDALVREVREEVEVAVDRSWGPFYLGGWQQARARDNLINDNFSVFAVRLTNEDFVANKREVREARFFEWRPLLEAWRAAGQPEAGLSHAEHAAVPSGQKINRELLLWLDTYERGQCLKTRFASRRQGLPGAHQYEAGKLLIGM